jgi:hypothetical protein
MLGFVVRDHGVEHAVQDRAELASHVPDRFGRPHAARDQPVEGGSERRVRITGVNKIRIT